jgi:tRNA(Ile)-lysidine synthase TilS/MesJ
MDVKKLNKIIDDIFPPNEDLDKIISAQDIIGMRLSGGIDSAFLMFLIMNKWPNKKILPITMFNRLRPAAMDSVSNVMSALKILKPENENILEPEYGFFDTTGFVRTQEMVDEFKKTGKKYNPKDIFQRSWFYKLWDKYDKLNVNLTIYITGETLNPPIEEQSKIDIPELQSFFPPDRNHTKDVLWSVKELYKGHNRYEVRPFRNKNKKEIAQYVKELGLDKTLFPVTETCETEIHMYEVYSKMCRKQYKKPGEEPCKVCWPCREKYWAYGVYDFNTPETDKRHKLSEWI